MKNEIIWIISLLPILLVVCRDDIESAFKGMHRYFFVPAAYHCKNMKQRHLWIASDDWSGYPVCKHCGKCCTWAYGYTTNFGTTLDPDWDAQDMVNEDARDFQMVRNSRP